MRETGFSWGLAGVVVLLAAGASAEDPGAPAHLKTKGSDPSEIVSRLELRNELLDLPEGGYWNGTVFRADWAPTAWVLGRLEVPVVVADTAEAGSATGLGDMLVGLRGKLALGERWSLLGEVAFILDTAGDEALGTGSTQAVPFGVVVWKPSPAWILGLEYQWFGSFGRTHDHEEIRESAIRPQALYHLSYGCWFLVDPRVYVNHAEGGDVAFFPEGELGKVLTDHVELWVRGGGKAVGDGRTERVGWRAEAGVRYLFD